MLRVPSRPGRDRDTARYKGDGGCRNRSGNLAKFAAIRPRLVLGKQIGGRPPTRFHLVIEIAECLAAAVFDDEAGGALLLC
jgi:hypothetical protein